MAEYIANVDYELEAIPVSPGTWEPGVPSEVRVEASAASAPAGKAILVQQIAYTYAAAPVPPAAPCKLSGYTFGGGVGIIQATAVKTKCDGLPVMRENDIGACAGAFTQGSTTMACACTLKIKAAGQNKVSGL